MRLAGRGPAAFAASLALAACSAPSPAATPISSDDSELVIYNDADGARLLDLCSREAPDAYDGRWDASVADVTLAEQVLTSQHPEILARAGITAEQFRDDWLHEYAGFTRNGRRYLYGSFGPGSGIGLCDGGPAYFGVEFEMPAARVTHQSFNGRG